MNLKRLFTLLLALSMVLSLAACGGSGFAFLNVDDFQVSLTTAEVAALELAQLEKIQAETYTSASYDDLTTLLNYYNIYPYPVPLESLTITAYAQNQVVDCGTVDVTAFLADAAATYGGTEITDLVVTKVTVGDTEITEGFDAVDMSAVGYYYVTYGASYEGKAAEATFTVVAVDNHNQVANGDFEAGNLAGWTVLTDNWNIVDGQATGVISAETYWGENLPYNQAGSYHMDGWNTGIDEAGSWQLQSSSFTLAGGGSWADMGTYVMDLSAYIGQEMYIVLCDEVIDGGWAHAFFDEVVTYYEAAPDYANLYDTVTDGASDGTTPAEAQIPWQLAVNLA